MTLRELAERCGFGIVCGGDGLEREVRSGYVSDLMSDVLGHAREGDLWVTLQTHANIVAVAAAKDLSGILLIGGNEPEPQTLERAQKESVPILRTGLAAFETVGRLYALGLRGGAPDAQGA